MKVVQIEDRDVKGLAIPFIPWESQEPVIESFLNDRLLIILKARQLGLTWLALAYSLWRMLFNVGQQVNALSKREEPDAKELIRRMEFMLRHLPSWLVQERKHREIGWGGPVWSTSALKVTIHHKNDESSVFQSLTAARDSGRSFTANVVILDEWAFQQWAWEIYSAAYPSINRPSGGQVIGISTAARGTLFEHIWETAERGQNNFKPIFLPWWADPRRDEEWYENTKRDLPNHQAEYPATPQEAFSASEGHAFPEFNQEVHICEPFSIPDHWPRWRSNDPGYTDPFVWYWFAVSEDGQVYCYREYSREDYEPRVVYSEQAAMVVTKSVVEDGSGMPEPEDIMFTVTGRDAFTKHPETGKCIADYYMDGGIGGLMEPPRDVRTDRVFRRAVVHEYMKPYLDDNDKSNPHVTAKLQIFSTCNRLIETLPRLLVDKWDPEKVQKSAKDHWFDALGYGLVAWHINEATPPREENKSPIKKHKEKVAKRNQKRLRKLV